MRFLHSPPDAAKREAIKEAVSALAQGGDREAAWTEAQPLRRALRDRDTALALAQLVRWRSFVPEDGTELLVQLADVHARDMGVMTEVGAAISGIPNVDYLNAAPPDDERLDAVVETLLALRNRADTKELIGILDAAGLAGKALGRAWDARTEAFYDEVRELEPGTWFHHYNAGLFFKTRGRFEEGLAANRRALELSKEPRRPVLWNLGICATGAFDADTALEIWLDLGQKIGAGRFGLPEGGYPSCKVHLAERPLAERPWGEVPNDPGLQETIWLERLSPCHGIIRSVLYQDLGVDYGDVVLFDGAPTTVHTIDGQQVPVFPHLATLVRNDYQLYNFGGTQAQPHQVADLSDALPADAVVYAHTEAMQFICHACWENPNGHHDHDTGRDHRVVTGQIAAPPDLEPSELLRHLDAAVAASKDVTLLVPTLAENCGLDERAKVEQRRLAMLEEN